MCGIFGYCNFGVPRTSKQVLDILFGGLRALEYRGYDRWAEVGQAGVRRLGRTQPRGLVGVSSTPRAQSSTALHASHI